MNTNLQTDPPHPSPAHAGDPAEQFMRLFLANQRRFFGLILSMVPNASDAEDLLQETSSLMWQRFTDFTPGTDFVSWGLRFARNVCMNFNRKRRTAGKVVFSDELLNQIADEAFAAANSVDARHEALRRCIAKLSERARQLLDMRYEPGATAKDVARRTGRTIQAVYKAIERIQDALLECIERSLAAEGAE